MLKKRLFGILPLIVGVMLVFSLMGCDDSNGGKGGGKNVGCKDLSAGTECSAHSSCSNHFLCLTGQGSDNNCTTGCSCQ